MLGIGNHETVLKHRVEVELPYGKCRILDIDALIRAKEATNRDHDRITVKYLKEIKKRQSRNLIPDTNARQTRH
jgi:rRNA maturation endonuclease Nob1